MTGRENDFLLRKNLSRPCSPTLRQLDWFSWTENCPLSRAHPVPPNLNTPLSQSYSVPPNMETPLSLSHLSHVLQPVPTCPIWLYHLPVSFPNSLFSDFFLAFSLSFHFSKNTHFHAPTRHLGSLTSAKPVYFDFILSCSSC